jgi:hypothetical protein
VALADYRQSGNRFEMSVLPTNHPGTTSTPLEAGTTRLAWQHLQVTDELTSQAVGHG